MVRKLKHHEQKLLKKVNFVEANLKVVEVLRRYHVQQREDYTKYNRLCGLIQKTAAKLIHLDPKDPFRVAQTDALLEMCYKMGVIPTKKNLNLCGKVSASAFCRRRLPIVMVRLRMCETVKEAVRFVEQGHVRVGPQPVTDPAFLVTRAMEDFVTWTDTSKIRKHVAKYNDKLDDYDLL